MKKFANDYIQVLASDHETLDRGYALVEYLEATNSPIRPINYWDEGFISVKVENYNVAIAQTHLSTTSPRLYLDTSLIKHMYTSDDKLVLGVEFDGHEYVLTIDGSIVVISTAQAAQQLAAAAD